MEIVELSESNHSQHKWLKWAGLQERPVAPDSLVPIVRALALSDPAAGTSRVGDRLVELLSRAGIEAYQRPYEWAGTPTMFGGGRVETHVAVLVHERDREPAVAIAMELNRILESEAAANLSDDELTRQALAAGKPPEA